MRILVDGRERDWRFDDEQTLGEVIVEVNKLLMREERRVVIGLKIDDERLSDDIKSLTPDQVTLDRVEQISFETQLYVDNLTDELVNSEQTLQKVQDSISTIVGHILSEEMDIAMNSLKESIENLIMVINLLIQSSAIGAIELESIKCGDGTLKEFMGRFKSTLQELSAAMENNDMTLINDFLEYELEPQLGELKTAIKPVCEQVKNFKF